MGLVKGGGRSSWLYYHKGEVNLVQLTLVRRRDWKVLDCRFKCYDSVYDGEGFLVVIHEEKNLSCGGLPSQSSQLLRLVRSLIISAHHNKIPQTSKSAILLRSLHDVVVAEGCKL
jgi:hypothetical protein